MLVGSNRVFHEGFLPNAGQVGTYTKSEIDSKDNLKLNLTGGKITGPITLGFDNESVLLNLGTTRPWTFRTAGTQGASGLELVSNVATKSFRVGHKDGHMSLSVTADTDETKCMVQMVRPRAIGAQETRADSLARKDYVDTKLSLTGGTLTGELSSGRIHIKAPSERNATGLNYSAAGEGSMLVLRTSNGDPILGAADEADAWTSYLAIRKTGVVDFNSQLGVKQLWHTGNLLTSDRPVEGRVAKWGKEGMLLADTMASEGLIRTSYTPAGGLYSSKSSDEGAIKIALPTWKTSTMIKVYLSVYEYVKGKAFDVVASGYEYSDGSWRNCSAVIVGGTGTATHSVRFGQDGSKACIWIGELSQKWSNLQVRVTKVETSYSSDSPRWNSGWAISVVKSFDTVNFDLQGCLLKPGLAPAAHKHNWSDLTEVPATASRWPTAVEASAVEVLKLPTPGDYGKAVVLLHKLDNSDKNSTYRFHGEVTWTRSNNLDKPLTVKVESAKKYDTDTATGWVTANGTILSDGFRLATCQYQGVKWLALEHKPANAQGDLLVRGVWTTKPEQIVFLNTRSGTEILNEEIYSSIAEFKFPSTPLTHSGDLFVNYDDKVFSAKNPPTAAQVKAVREVVTSEGFLRVPADKWWQAATTGVGFLPFSNGTSYVGTSSWKFKEMHSVNITGDNITAVNGVSGKKIQAAGNAGYFHGDANYTKFTGSSFYIEKGTPITYIYSPSIYLGDNSGCSVFLRGNSVEGTGWKINSGGDITARNITAALNGNAASATKLATARSINGVNFDGTGNITITAAANGGTADKVNIKTSTLNAGVPVLVGWQNEVQDCSGKVVIHPTRGDLSIQGSYIGKGTGLTDVPTETTGYKAVTRVIGTTYTNSGNKMMAISAWTVGVGSDAYLQLFVNNTMVVYVRDDGSGGVLANLYGLIPPGAQYRLEGNSIDKCFEMQFS